MKSLIRKAHVIYPGSSFHNKTTDVLIENGVVLSVENQISDPDAEEIKGDALYLFPSLVDLQCTVGEPGFEDKEDFESLSKAARSGGFGTVVILPNTDPVVDHGAQVRFVHGQTRDLPTSIKCYGSISSKCQGENLSELFDMHKAGAVGFTDGKHPISDVNLMKRALEYTKGFDGCVHSFPFDERINPGAMIHESAENTRLGIKQSPSLAEELMLNRDLYLLEYTQSKMHVSTISTKGSVDLIRQAKKKGLKVTCGVALHNLLYTDADLTGFDSNFKVLPPLRSRADRDSLISALTDGTIDVIVSDHTPELIENKEREFEHASYGMTMLETALPQLAEQCSELSIETIVKTFALNPRSILNTELPKLEPGSKFDFTLFDPALTWDYSGENILSKSQNSPVIKSNLKGRVVLPK